MLPDAALLLQSSISSLPFFRIVESNLCKALYELTCDNQSIEKNYDVPSGMRSKNCVKALLECARFLDEQDMDGLNSFQLDFKVWTLSVIFAIFKNPIMYFL